MVGVFRDYNPFGIIFLFFYGLILKYASFLQPHIPVAQPTDGFLYHSLLRSMESAGKSSPVIYSLFAYVLVFVQSIMLNTMVNNRRLLPKPSFLAAMSYLLITSFFPEWWQLSSTLIVNTFLIWIFSRMSILYSYPKAKLLLLNVGFVLGVSSFFYFPSLAFLLLIFFALLIMRPFRLVEWMVGLLGIMIPYYFLFAWMFLQNDWNIKKILPSVTLSYPTFQQTIWAWGGLLLLVIPFMISGFIIQGSILRMLIQVRKNWSLMLVYLLLAMLVPFINSSSTFEYWILSALPFAVFHAGAFYFSKRRYFPVILHWLMVIFVLALNWALLGF
ncbi:hypothetical protein [Pollutibacter soli]|uniref:hypothetical protein n=1 Tax=Pollutibacter soli TaxID=3034157 RepID=UPI0030137FA6